MKNLKDKIIKLWKNLAGTFGFGADQSRIKKKLILYFLLISIVSISISIEIVWEVSEQNFRDKLTESFYSEFQKAYTEDTGKTLSLSLDEINQKTALSVLDDMRMRMLLLIGVIIGNIFTAFRLFSKDIARPIDALVEGAKKVSDGDLTAEIEILTEDEIGELGQLINDMNINLQELIMEIRHEMDRLTSKINSVKAQLQDFNTQAALERAVSQKTMSLKALRKMVVGHEEIEKMLDDMIMDLDSLTALINMYKLYQITEGSELHA